MKDRVVFMKEMRLQKYLAECGVASRRKAEELISQGRVKVNGETVTQMGKRFPKTMWWKLMESWSKWRKERFI